jgi:CelD/BcsL family acetyltransferase involved in cellulose biosynthesis
MSNYTVTIEPFESLYAHWRTSDNTLHWPCPFILPPWLQTWWNSFGSGYAPHICAVREGNQLAGIAPLMVQGDTACFMGNTDVCDYQDCIIAPGKETEFFRHLIVHLQKQGVAFLNLGLVRPDSSVYRHLPPVADALGRAVLCTPEDVVLELNLPATWDEFLHILHSKERHEIRRKLRRLDEAGRTGYRSVEDAGDSITAIDTFLALFSQNRDDKLYFMTEQMALFFRSAAVALANEHILKLLFLTIDEQPVAAVMCLDYNNTVYLYNNGYNSQYRSLSVGLLSKVFSIRDSIQQHKKKYDFLKGAEVYKQRLGGEPVSLYRCKLIL